MSNRIEYDSSLPEIADVHFRVQKRSRMFRRTRLQAAFVSAAITAALTFLMLASIGAELIQRFAFAGVAAAVTALAAWLHFPWSLRRRILKYLRERLKSDEPVHFAVELRDDCVWAQQAETRLSFDWDNVVKILDSKDGVEFQMRDGSWLFVRERGFPTPESRRDFVQTATRKTRDPQTRKV